MAEGIIDAIKDDHAMLRKRMEQVKKGREEMSANLTGAYREFQIMFNSHMHGEERFFYPTLLNGEESREDALESLEEHHVSRFLLDELNDLTMDDERWKAKFGVLAEVTEHHFEEEEEKLFAMIGSLAGPDRQEELGRLFEEEERKFDVAAGR